MGKRDEILSLFPDGLKGRMKPVLEDVEHLNEIRLGVNRPCRIIREGCEYFLSQDGTCLTQGKNAWLTSDREIESIVNQMCSYSLYAFENELRQGFLTVQGGHRIGFAGKVILNTDGSVRNFSCIRFLNIRISHEILGMADPVLPYLFQQGELWNTLIISPPGCGKSTIAAILSGARTATEGEVTLGGIPVSEWKQADRLRLLTLVPHNAAIFKGTVEANLRMARPDAAEAELWAALEQVNLADFCRSQSGLATALHEGGSNLSGGQRQRLAMARALLHDSPIYVFDEATSNVDAESENDMMKAIHSLAGKKTVILISHRLANVVDSDCIYVLEAGRIAEQGTHHDLLAAQGVYSRLYNAQKQLEDLGEVSA